MYIFMQMILFYTPQPLLSLLKYIFITKTECILFSRSLKIIQPTAHIHTLHGFQKENVESYKYLGIWSKL